VREEIVHTMSNEVLSGRPRRRYYSNALKAEVVRSCGEPGASIAAIALSHGINANIVHRWVRELASTLTVAPTQDAFLSLPLATTGRGVAIDAGTAAVIEIELRRGGSSALIRWPLEGVESCAALLRDWLR
jgi:transposase